MQVVGSWDTTMKTPIGTLRAVFTFTGADGELRGVATGKQDPTDMRDLTVTVDGDAELVTWRQSITTPLRLDLDFAVTVSGDSLQGFSTAGRLPRSTVTGTRASQAAPPPG